MEPLCGFYAVGDRARAARHFRVPADAQVHECRASGGGKGRCLNVEVSGRATPGTGCRGVMVVACVLHC